MSEPGATPDWTDQHWLATCALFYAPMAGFSAWWMELGPPPSVASWSWAVPGVLAGIIIHVGLRQLPWFHELAAGLRAQLGDMRLSTALVVALASGVAEEWLFRGVLLQAWGPLLSTLAFAAAHPPTERRLVTWPLFALGIGALAAWMTLWSGGLIAAAAMHVAINALGLLWLRRTNAPRSRD